MTAKNRKLLAILGSVAVLVVAAALIVVFTGGSADKPAPGVTDNSGTVSVGEITDQPDTSGDNVDVPDIKDNSGETPNTEKTDTDPVLNIENSSDVNVNISEFDDEKTTPEPPKVNNESALTNPDTKTTYDDQQTTVTPDSGTPKNGDKKPGYIYLEGFGWIVDEGGQAQGGTVGNEGDELTGNQVGNMG
ncbi:MAG: hypothetical protein PHV32_17630 [Eubacteriales bacterium]|nr:hypothetical protein [Eubacteriales bacterium]